MTSMSPPERSSVFLSSSIEGSEDLRSVIVAYFEDYGYLPICYGDICSGPRTGKLEIKDECLNGVRHSNNFVLVIDKRYGDANYQDEDGNYVSLTELEFFEACKHGIRRYTFCREEVWIVHKVWNTNKDLDFSFDPTYDHPNLLMNFLTKAKAQEREIMKFRDVNEFVKILERIGLSMGILERNPSEISENENLGVIS